jgi:hypothetical protein
LGFKKQDIKNGTGAGLAQSLLSEGECGESEDSAAVLAVSLLNDRGTDPCVYPFGLFLSLRYILYLFFPPLFSVCFFFQMSCLFNLRITFFLAVFLRSVDSSFCAL